MVRRESRLAMVEDGRVLALLAAILKAKISIESH